MSRVLNAVERLAVANWGAQSMQVDGDFGTQPSLVLNQSDVNAQPSPPETSRARKVTVQLSRSTFQRLEAATDRPGLGKSVVVEAALERFLDPAPAVEGLVYEALDRITDQMNRLEHEIAVIAETVALHARYHLTLAPPMPASRQPAACALGNERFRALAEQVARRVRAGRSLMRETIEGPGDPNRPLSAIDSDTYASARERADQQPHRAAVEDERSKLPAAAREDGSSLNFRHLPNAFC